MTTQTVASPGQINSSGDRRALFLKVFGGEVLTEFNKDVVMMDKHTVRTISSGKSAQFPAIGRVTANYHTPGTELTGQAVKHNERIITLDDALIADVFIADVDEAMSHYEYRGEYVRQMKDALVQAFDRNVMRVGILASRSAATISGLDGGGELTNANYLTDMDQLADGYKLAAIELDNKAVPAADRFALVKPAQFYGLVEVDKLVNRDYAGKGSIADGKVDSAFGISIVKTVNLPMEDVTSGGANAGVDPITGVDVPTQYQADFSNVASLVMNRSAIGTLKLKDLAVESDGYEVRYQGTLFAAKYLLGHGILRPQCAVELNTVAN